MSKDAKDSLVMPASWKALACSVAALLAVGFTAVAPATAQDATPAAAGECVAPDLPPGTVTPMEASPMADEMAETEMGMATPEAEMAASPEAEDPGTPAEGEDADAILAAAWNLANCVNSGDYEGAVALVTEELMMEELGTSNPYDAVEFLAGFTMANFQVSNPMVYQDGSVSADVQYSGSQYQLNAETWFLVQDGEYWKLDSFEGMTPEYEGDAAIVGVNLTETEGEDGSITYAIAPNRPDIAQIEVLVFHAINAGSEDHEIVAFRLPDGADPMGLLDGSIPETDVEFLGQISVDAGEQGDMVLVGLEPGVYTLACFIEDAEGVPHIVNGMVSQFEVLAPA